MHKWIDSHAHVDLEKYDEDRDEVLGRAESAGVGPIINILMGPETQTIERALAFSEKYPQLYFAIGIHPHDADKTDKDTLENLKPYFLNPKVVAVGEIGLDYFYKNSEIKKQKECFREWSEWAIERKLPVSIHTRDAFRDTQEILQSTQVMRNCGGVIHCFTGNKDEARAYLDLGAMISFSGIITFKNASAIQEAAKYVPLDRILIETDCPFLAPTPHRGKRNEPAYVEHVAECLANLKGETLESISKATLHNTKALFKL